MLTPARRLSTARRLARLGLALGLLLALAPPGLAARTAAASGRSDIYYIWRRRPSRRRRQPVRVRPSQGARGAGHQAPLVPAPLLSGRRRRVQAGSPRLRDVAGAVAGRADRHLSPVAIAVLLYHAPASGRAGRCWACSARSSGASTAGRSTPSAPGGLERAGAPAAPAALLECFGRRRRLAFLLLGTSLAIKHVATPGGSPCTSCGRGGARSGLPGRERGTRSGAGRRCGSRWSRWRCRCRSCGGTRSAFVGSILELGSRGRTAGYGHVSAVGSLLGPARQARPGSRCSSWRA